MNLLAISYHNIGPFQGEPLTCFFPNGKYLIKAPIGSGKSFLFFDGPMFGLYKLANRNMLNALSKEGYVKILAEVNEEIYFIIRNLKAAKAKDSCASIRYKVDGDMERLRKLKTERHYGIVTKQLDIADLLAELHFGLEEIAFKNETDLQQNLQSILPPKEVFLNTVFLMQDSDNIFQLAPADRLSVLKNVFNLLAIDEGKEIIADKKREVTYKLKATADTSKYDAKLQHLLRQYTDTFTALLAFKDYADISNILEKKEYKDFLDDIALIQEKITIPDFAVNVLPTNLAPALEGWIAGYKEQYTVLQQSKQLIEKSQEKHKLLFVQGQKKIQEWKDLIASIDKQTSGVDPQKIQAMKKDKQALQAQQDALDAKMPKKEFLTFAQTHAVALDFTLSETLEEIHIPELIFFTHALVTFGKNVNEKVQNIDLQIKNLELHASQQKASLEQDIKNTAEKIKDIQRQTKNVKEKIKLFDSDIQQQATFNCEKIGTNCPFIKVINKKHFDALAEQKKRLVDEKTSLEKTMQTAQDALHHKETQLQEIAKQDTITKDIAKYQTEKQSLQSLVTAIKNFLQEVDYAGLQKEFALYQDCEGKIKTLDKDIGTLETLMQQVETLRLEKEKHAAHIASTQESLIQIKKDQETQHKEIETIDAKIQALAPECLQNIERLTTTIKEIFRDITVLVNEFKDIQMEVKKFQEEEKLLNELYHIFSKELLLLVLQDSLPVLNEIINSYLNQVVDYQVMLDLVKTASDKLELSAKITDEKGDREIKSLSGGQMVILKIVRMLSISSYIRSPILFMDETINNLDIETVGRVADMLKDFVKQRSMKLYTVTHSQQVQQMDIWDEIVEIGDWR